MSVRWRLARSSRPEWLSAAQQRSASTRRPASSFAPHLQADFGWFAPRTARYTREEAEATARRDQPASPAVREARRLEAAPVELRGKPLPAWRIELDDAAHTVVYVDATSGEVTARRSDLWRAYDFLWSLHIMDYRERESFNHLLIRGASVLAVLTVFSGVVLWVLRARRWWRERT